MGPNFSCTEQTHRVEVAAGNGPDECHRCAGLGSGRLDDDSTFKGSQCKEFYIGGRRIETIL